MELIAHRGNLEGTNEEWENYPDYLEDAINKGFSIEADIWWSNWAILDDRRIEYQNYYWFLGHDFPKEKITLDFLIKFEVLGVLYAHAKTITTMYELHKNNIHCFYHDRDKATFTNRGLIWTYPGNELTPKSICVLPEIAKIPYTKKELQNCYGVCTDYIYKYKDLLLC